jgi:hypothetical protein
MSLCTSQSVCGLRNALVQSRKFSSSKCSATSASPRPVRASASGCSGTDGTDCTAANRFGVLGVVGLKALNVASRFSAKVSQLSTVSDADAEAINGQIQANLKGMRTLAMVVPFAAVSGSSSTFMILTKMSQRCACPSRVCYDSHSPPVRPLPASCRLVHQVVPASALCARPSELVPDFYQVRF